MFVDFFIRRPIFAGVCAVLIVLLGAIAIPTLPVAQYPQLAPPQVTVTSTYVGANAETIETTVTTPLEQQINGAQGMRYMTSQSTDGQSVITVTFELGRDPDLAAVDVQNRVARALPRLPQAVTATGVVVAKTTPASVLVAGLYAEHGEYDALFLSNYTELYIVDALRRIPGVADVRVFGQRRYAMRLWLDPTRLASRSLTAADVVNALREQNVQVAAGQIGQPPTPPGQLYQLTLRAQGRLRTAEEFEGLVLSTAADGTLVHLRDVGRAELGAEDYTTILRFNGREAVGFAIYQLPDANALEVARAGRDTLARLSRRFPPGMKYRLAVDPTAAVRASIREVLLTLGIAIALVIAVIYLFLQNWRATLIPAITIPVSLVGTFAFVKALGFSINLLTLFGLTLATGLVVDDAIVVIENIARHAEEHRVGFREAASAAMKEVAGAVVAMTLVLVSVFVPVAFFPGTTGQFYRQFSLTIAFSVLLSGFNAVTLTPALAAVLLRHAPARWRWTRYVNRGIDAGTRGYVRGLHATLRHRALGVAAFALVVVGAFVFYRRVPAGFVPTEDQGYFITTVQGPPGASLEYTVGVLRRIEREVAREPDVDNVFAVAGFSFAGPGSNRGLVFSSLRPIEQRRGAAHGADAILRRLAGRFARVPAAVVVPLAPPPIQGIGALGGFQFQVVDESTSGELSELGRATDAVLARGRRDRRLASMFTGFTANDPQLLLGIDRERTKALGIPINQVFDTLGVYMGSQYVNDFDLGTRSYRVYAQADARFRGDPRAVEQLYVRARNNAMVPLATLVRTEPAVASQIIPHYNMFRAAEIDGAPAPGFASGDAIAAMDQAAAALPPGMSYQWTGLYLEQLAAGSSVALIFALAVLIVFLVLAAQYESLALPLVVLIGLPTGVLGAMAAVSLRGLQNDIYAQVGLVMLLGLTSKNAILIVEFAAHFRARGVPAVEAAVEAARVRLRPIVMTSLAFILGAMPLMLAEGAGAYSRRSLGTTVVGGMLAATAVNLFVTPLAYVLVELARERLLARRARNAPPPPPEAGGSLEPAPAE